MSHLSKDIDINIRLNNIFMKRFDINIFDNDCVDDNLLGSKFGLRARHLIYLLNDIEKEFGIITPQKDIDDGKFNTINNIIDIINKELQQKDVEAV